MKYDWFSNQFGLRFIQVAAGSFERLMDRLRFVFPQSARSELVEQILELIYNKTEELSKAGVTFPKMRSEDIPKMVHHVRMALTDGSVKEFWINPVEGKSCLEYRVPYLGMIKEIKTDVYEFYGSFEE